MLINMRTTWIGLKQRILYVLKKLIKIVWVQDVEISKINICDESSTFIDIFRYCPHPYILHFRSTGNKHQK